MLASFSERLRSMARDQAIIHAAGPGRESAASLGSGRRLLKPTANPERIPPSINHGHHKQHVAVQGIVDAKREPLRQGAMIAKLDFMDATVVGERLDVGDQAAAE
jgi:hypothetical protein